MKLISIKNIFFPSFNSEFIISVDADKLEKIHLIQLFNLGALIFIFPLSFKALFFNDYSIGLTLLAVGTVILANYYYLKKYGHINRASHLISIVFFLLMLYLLYTGGVNHTGPLWVLSYPIIVLFLLGLRIGFVYILLFLLLSFIILFIPFDALAQTGYSYDYKVRIILSFLLITLLSSFYEYSNKNALNRLQKLKEELEYSSNRDYLTSLYNRRGYDQKIKNLQNTQGIILMCDIDHFKKINDTYGHDAGDFVLQKVSKKIKNMLREDDIAVRWGGEEFFIFLPDITLESGHLVAEKIRKSIEDLLLNYEGQHIAVTFSIGLDEVTPDTLIEDAINNADDAMYQAKQAGRNTIIGFTTQ